MVVRNTATRHGWRRALKLRRVLALNFALVVLVGWGFAGEFMRSRSMEDEIGRLEEQAGALEVRNAELSRTADRLSGSSLLEREARLKLNMRRPGESVVVVRDEKTAGLRTRTAAGDPTAVAEGAVAGNQVSNYHKWIRHFFPHD